MQRQWKTMTVTSLFLGLGDGMGGSLFWQDLISLAHSVGFSTPYLVSASRIVIYSNELKAKTGTKKSVSFWWHVEIIFVLQLSLLFTLQVTSTMLHAHTACLSCPKVPPCLMLQWLIKELWQISQIKWTLIPSTLSRYNKSHIRLMIIDFIPAQDCDNLFYC